MRALLVVLKTSIAPVVGNVGEAVAGLMMTQPTLAILNGCAMVDPVTVPGLTLLGTTVGGAVGVVSKTALVGCTAALVNCHCTGVLNVLTRWCVTVSVTRNAKGATTCRPCT